MKVDGPGFATNLFGGYDGLESFFGGKALLSESVGYLVLLGFGAFFSIFTTVIVFLDYKFGGTVATSEQFNTAGRSIKTGLTASVIVSQWTWAATLLQVGSSTSTPFIAPCQFSPEGVIRFLLKDY